MPKLSHKSPCKQCPWRKSSVNGYLGGSTAEEFYEQIESEVHIPCHLHVDYDGDDNDELVREIERAPYCAGSLIHMKNNCKQPRDLDLRHAVMLVDRSDKVFSFKHQFVEHHNKDFKPK